MPTNATTFNSRVTSEALEAKFRQVFPAQGGAELVQDLFASGVIQPVVDFSSVAEGSVLPQNLQTAWDFATGHNKISNTTTVFINNTGFWLVQVNLVLNAGAPGTEKGRIFISDGLSTKTIWAVDSAGLASDVETFSTTNFVVFLRSGDTLSGTTPSADDVLDVSYRQIATVNGTLVNPLGFTFT